VKISRGGNYMKTPDNADDSLRAPKVFTLMKIGAGLMKKGNNRGAWYGR